MSKCLYPIEVHSDLVACGQCINCRINKRREWTGRILLESQMHQNSCFVTLTYNDLHQNFVPHPEAKNLKQSNLVPDDMTAFLARLRKTGAYRYYAVGEYGDKTERAHWHLILFGIGIEEHDRIANAWKKDGEDIGFITVGEFNAARAAYCANYIQKKLTKNNDALDGRYPEHSRKSQSLGMPAIRLLEDICYTKSGCEHMTQIRDVPRSFRFDGKIYPIANWLRIELRRRLGIPKLLSDRNALFGTPLIDTFQFDEDFYSLEEHDIINKRTPAKLYVKKIIQTGQLPGIRKTADFLEKKRLARKRYGNPQTIRL